MATATPWGFSQQSKKIAVGINSYSTAGHGGFKLSAGRMKKLPEEIKAVKTWGNLGAKGWFEEDCDWALVPIAFPEEFDNETFDIAVKTVKMFHKDQIDVDAYLAERSW